MPHSDALDASDVLAVSNLNIAFQQDQQRTEAVRNLSFRLRRGETLAIVGESGSGKSVTALSLMRLIEQSGGEVQCDVKVFGVRAEGDRLAALQTSEGEVTGRQFLFTPAFPIIADILQAAAPSAWINALRRVKYLGNMCLVLRLKQSLSETYWLNVNDPGFPFVGVIEHTNFDSSDNYRGSAIAFLSRYLPVDDPVWGYTDEQYVEFALEHLQRMFPELKRDWIAEYKVWRAEYAQPVTERDYSKYVPGPETPFSNARISTMAQIYPEDRGTNYAIREGRSAARALSSKLRNV